MSNTYFYNDCASTKTYFYSFIFILAMVLQPTSLLAASSVPKTGQTERYTNNDDGDLEKGVSWPSPRFLDNSDGTITDILTNLTWLKNANCSSGTWTGVLDDASTLEPPACDLSDGSSAGEWRVPNVKELESLLHMGVNSPALPNKAGSGGATYQSPFTSLQTNEYWSSTTNTASPSNALIIDVRYGQIKSGPKGSSYSALFVRDSDNGTPVAQVYATGQILCYDGAGVTLENCTGTGQDGELRIGKIVPPPRFSDNLDGTVYDNLTGLTWLKNTNCLGFASWASAIFTVNTLSDGTCGLNDSSVAGDWRIPNGKELLSLIDYGFQSPALSNGAPFTGVQPTSGYWSSTTYSGFTGNAWYVSFNAGTIGSDSKVNVAYIWPIKNDPVFSLTVSTPGDGTGKVTSSPSGITCPGECNNDFGRFTSVYLTAQADRGSRFDGWSIASCGNSATCHVYMSADQSVTATFIKNSATVSAWEILLLSD